ncbi:amino acid adenylation domain-containing protein [Chitinophaga oryzae]|uniref:Amino acid adenylation domain-containing protein n=2 Tax=Chitinophaga oryzae TaxID=2725414 RepID=A0ABX6LDG1_9BACT|nr:non-ribosomal peptide synthetase [Chitinophaga oryzae]QJB38091.1 amino acid adenylation domain-containing protein [Chitinophaga oryzae]
MKEFLVKLKKENIHLSLDNGDISVKYLSEHIDTALIQEIRAKKKDLVDYLSAQHKNGFSGIMPVALQPDYPASAAQKRLWIVSQADDASVAYNVPLICNFNGTLDVASLEAAFRQLISRHEILRTAFHENGNGELRQRIYADGAQRFRLGRWDLRDRVQPETAARQKVEEITRRLFTLTEGPLLTADLLQIDTRRYVLVCVMHHIISDGWSTGVMMGELMASYHAFTNGEDPAPAPLRIQYKDFAVWQESELSGEKLAAHRRYWLQQFDGPLPLLDLASDRQRPVVKTYNGAVVSREINAPLFQVFKKLLQQEGATLFMGLTALLKALLYRYTGQEDIIIGSPVAGRDHIDLEEQIGFYVNMLALRTRLSGEDTYRILLRKVKQITLGAYEHQVYPFDALVSEVYTKMEPGRHPLFDVVLALQNMNDASRQERPAASGDLSISPYSSSARVVSLFDLRIDCREADDRLLFLIEYNTDIYDGDRIERMADNLTGMMQAVVNAPDALLCRLSYLDAAELKMLTGNVNAATYPTEETMVSLFEAQADRTPHAVAVALGEQSLTYRQLDEYANRIAHFLIRTTALQREEGVAVILNRTPDCIAALLGILKAGGMYIPMEADLPEDRLKFMLRDAGVRVLITEKSFLETANRLQWACSRLEAYCCLDSNDLYQEKEQQENVMMARELWDHVGDSAVDQITGGGWGNSFTGGPISALEMEEYSMNAYLKLKPLLHKDMRVLEIGCSSGLTLCKVAPEVGFYYGTDLSPVIIGNAQQMVVEREMTNVQLQAVVAHDIGNISERGFDLVIINSVIQHFHGHNYLRNVLSQAASLMKDTGWIFIGDVMDADRKENLVADLLAFKAANKNTGSQTKTDFSADLFIARGFLEDLVTEANPLKAVAITDKICTVENELTRYRYDALLTVDKTSPSAPGIKRNKWQYSNTVLAEQPSTRPALPLSPGNLAYLIYTSGTTGQPKGVQVQHDNVVRLFMTDPALFDFNETDVWTMFHSYSFDFSVWEMYGALFFGGKLILVPKAVAQDAAAYLQLLSEQQVTVLNQTPSAFYNLSAEILHTAGLSLPLRYVIFGGEALNPGKLENFHAAWPAVRLINMYGITETTVHVTYKEITSAAIRLGISNIGKPIPTLSCYVLDANGELLPVGVPGELYVGGAGVARGYLNREALTAQRFLPDTFAGNGRLYRSGDKVKLLPDGEIEYLGRMDHQVKIRGYRIETGEIEACLLKQEQIDKVKVVARQDRDGGKYLVAYFTGDAETNVKELRSALEKLLPLYMVPSFFVQIAEFPLTRNGKTDVSRLPDPLSPVIQETAGYIAPANETERLLAAMWEDILGRERISMEDNFFELGGHSLKAMQLKSRIRKEMGRQIALKELFSHNTVRSLARLLENNFHSDEDVSIPRMPEQESYPASYSQRRFWALCQLAESATAYNMSDALFLEGHLDLAALQQALHWEIQRHESLRTVFGQDDAGDVRQYILPAEEATCPIAYMDISHHPDPDAVLRRLYETDQATLFDLTAELLIRIRVVKVKEHLHAIFCLMHHIICDGWSMEILAGELGEAYNCFAAGQAPAWPPLEIQYRDYAAWKNKQQPAENEAYWLQQFTGEIPVLSLPSDYPRPALKTYKGNSIERKLPSEVVNVLRSFCNREDATLFMGLLAGLNALFYRYTGQEDLVVGTPIAGREHHQLENQVGLYLNTLALRTQFSGDDSFQALLARVKNVLLGGYSHGTFPFDQLVEKLQLGKDPGRSPLFDVCMVLQNQRSTNLSAAYRGMKGLAMVPFAAAGGQTTSQFDLLFNFNEKNDELHLLLNYSTDLFSEETICRFYDHFVQLLKAVTAAPQQPLCKVNYLRPSEIQQLIEGFNATEQDFPATTITALIEAQVAARPQDPAVVYGDSTLTYAALHQRVVALAVRLQEDHHLKRGDIAALIMDRSEYMIITLLALLRMGVAYVPIDPDYPEQRRRYMLSHSNAAVVLTDEAYREALSGYPLVVVSAVAGDREETALPAAVAQPEDMAYVIFTSGSTGQPKGCMISHSNLANYIQWANGFYFDGADTGNWALITPLAFDLTVTAIYTALTRGKTLYIGDRGKDIRQLLEDCFRHPGIDTLKLTPSHVSLLQGLDLRDTAIRTVICGGEQLTAAQVAILKTIHPDISVYNEYGPTETTVGCVACLAGTGRSILPIGKPAANTVIYILDAAGMPCPPGVYGEMYIGGAGVGMGYLHDPDQTKAKFVPDIFRPGERVYRSGDIAKWLPDGDLVFAGRKDNQVKINGYRIETEDIEQVILRQPGITAAAVIPGKTVAGTEQFLSAYYVAPESLQPDMLMAALQCQLPVYMLPRYITRLDALPVTLHGKLDTASLPDPRMTGLAGHRYVAPADETEAQLVTIWETVLERKGIGIHDNFFELGGNSLNVLRLSAAIKRTIGVDVSLRDILTYPTIAQLRRTRFTGQDSPGGPSGMHLANGPKNRARKNMFFVPPASGISYWYTDLLQALQQDVNGFFLNLRGVFDNGLPYTSIDELIGEWLGLILTEAGPGEPVFLAGYSSGGPIATILASLLEARGYRPVLFLLDAVPKDVYHETLTDREQFVSTIFPDVDRFSRLAETVAITADQAAVGRFLDMAFNFHCLWPGFKQPDITCSASAFVFVSPPQQNDLSGFHQWRNYIKGELQYIMLEDGEHMQLLQYKGNIDCMAACIRKALEFFG